MPFGIGRRELIVGLGSAALPWPNAARAQKPATPVVGYLSGTSQLRADEHAQYEIRAYANVLLDIIRKWMPLTFEAFVDYRMNAFSLSGPAIDVVRSLLAGAEIKQEDSRLSLTEWRELMKLLYSGKEGK